MTSAGSLERRLGLGDAVVLGLGSMLGTGVFVVWSPAAERAGRWLLAALAVAAVVAYCNATSTAQLAAVHPESGGAYVYGRRRLGRWWGVLAGAAFLIGKTASCAAAALAIGTYASLGEERWAAAAAVVAATALNLFGVGRTAAVTRVLVACVLAVLVLVVGTAVASPPAGTDGPAPAGHGATGVLAAAALFFFAFAGYARVATLGAEVRDPSRVIPRAIVLALGGVLLVYTVIGVTLLATLGLAGIAGSSTPLAAAVEGVTLVERVVRLGAAVAAFAILVPLLAGLARTAFAMASYGDLPNALAAVSGRRIPHRAQLLVALGVLAVTLIGELVGAVVVSAGAVLVYYAVANLAALQLSALERRWPRGLALLGLLGCVTLAGSLLTQSGPV